MGCGHHYALPMVTGHDARSGPVPDRCSTRTRAGAAGRAGAGSSGMPRRERATPHADPTALDVSEARLALLLFRTARTTKLLAARLGDEVAFGSTTSRATSRPARRRRGYLRHLGPREAHRAERTFPCARGPSDGRYDVVEIVPAEVSGRRFHISRPWLHMRPQAWCCAARVLGLGRDVGRASSAGRQIRGRTTKPSSRLIVKIVQGQRVRRSMSCGGFVHRGPLGRDQACDRGGEALDDLAQRSRWELASHVRRSQTMVRRARSAPWRSGARARRTRRRWRSRPRPEAEVEQPATDSWGDRDPSDHAGWEDDPERSQRR